MEEQEQKKTHHTEDCELRNRVTHREKNELQRWCRIQTWLYAYYPVQSNGLKDPAESTGETSGTHTNRCTN